MAIGARCDESARVDCPGQRLAAGRYRSQRPDFSIWRRDRLAWTIAGVLAVLLAITVGIGVNVAR